MALLAAVVTLTVFLGILIWKVHRRARHLSLGRHRPITACSWSTNGVHHPRRDRGKVTGSSHEWRDSGGSPPGLAPFFLIHRP